MPIPLLHKEYRSLNWTKVGLKDGFVKHNTVATDAFELD